jgi:hypothetical protein
MSGAWVPRHFHHIPRFVFLAICTNSLRALRSAGLLSD